MKTAIVLRNCLLDAEDGMVRLGNRIFHYYDRHQWHLGEELTNPSHGESYRRITKRLKQKPFPVNNAGLPKLAGPMISAIMPFSNNYYHFVCELLPCLQEFQHELAAGMPLAIPPSFNPPFRRFLAALGINMIEVQPNIYSVDELWLPSIPCEEWTADRAELVKALFDRAIHDWPGEFMIDEHGNAVEEKNNSNVKETKNRIYISRDLQNRRKLLNEDEIFEALKPYGFKRLKLETMELVDQARLFNNCSHMVGPHGAGLVNAVNAPKDCHVLNIKPIAGSGNFCFEQLCSVGWPNYHGLVVPKVPYFVAPVDLVMNVVKSWDL